MMRFININFSITNKSTFKLRIHMLNKMPLIIFTLLICHKTFAESVEINLPASNVFKKASFLLVDMEAIPSFRDKELGIIKTEPLPMKLTKNEADCGKMFGMPYIKDKRTKTAVTYQVNIRELSEKTSKVSIKLKIDGYMDVNEGAPFFIEKTRDKSKVLTCKSTGVLEADFIKRLVSE